jgi:hypothetical protein
MRGRLDHGLVGAFLRLGAQFLSSQGHKSTAQDFLRTSPVLALALLGELRQLPRMLDTPKRPVMRGPRRRLGPHTREHQLLTGLDMRSREGKLLAAARAELVAHIGGNPNHVQKILIERASRLVLYVELMDAKALEAGTMSERDSRSYLAWVNALRLCLREIGIDEAAPAKAPGLADYLASRANRAAAE